MKTKAQEKIELLELQILVNEMLPYDMQVKSFIDKMKVELARLKGPPKLVFVSSTDTEIKSA
ncbi:hypothetical protein [Bradyrhizobium sp. Leo170]|uniref:hypothetical protein n=1 Tax=Bradyrhizobium sp. Leo170 TaxID=1571199 RepID=UPI00102EA1A8|nr:hypothetical protein [Bradyrhizobium sp. Leo170]TAI63927.1 hypothetical protein CWO89_21640 [Bradyrhizobium sp. Leo170]